MCGLLGKYGWQFSRMNESLEFVEYQNEGLEFVQYHNESLEFVQYQNVRGNIIVISHVLSLEYHGSS